MEKFKIGDKVRIKSKDWFEMAKTIRMGIDCIGNVTIPEEMHRHMGKEYVVKTINISGSIKLEDCKDSHGFTWNWHESMLEKI